jgi:ribosome-binding factor A
METTRQQKISKLIQKDLGEIFQREIASLTGSYMLVTVTKVYVTKDLSIAKVYLSIFGVQDKEKAFELIKASAKPIRGMLAQRVRHQLRVIPELKFYLDDSLDYIEHIDELLKND